MIYSADLYFIHNCNLKVIAEVHFLLTALHATALLAPQVLFLKPHHDIDAHNFPGDSQQTITVPRSCHNDSPARHAAPKGDKTPNFPPLHQTSCCPVTLSHPNHTNSIPPPQPRHAKSHLTPTACGAPSQNLCVGL